MSKNRNLRKVATTSPELSTLEYITRLQRQVNNIRIAVVKAEAKYNSYVEKANIFTELYAEAEAALKTTEEYWKYFLQIKSDLQAIRQIGDEAHLVAVDTLSGVRQLIILWGEVTAETIEAAEAITVTADYIEKRKASNPLISNDLVTDAIAAAKAAAQTVTIVIKAYSVALSSLSTASQAAHSTELIKEYIKLAIAQTLEEKASAVLLAHLEKEGVKAKGIKKLIEQKRSLEFSLNRSLTDAQTKATLALKASKKADVEMNAAREKLAHYQFIMDQQQAELIAAKLGADYNSSSPA